MSPSMAPDPKHTLLPTVSKNVVSIIPIKTCDCVIKIGVDAISPFEDGYNWTNDGVNLWLHDNDSNITLNGEKCRVEIISANNENNETVAVAVAEQLIQQGVVAIIGPEYSSLAIPVGKVANDAQTPMIATTATNPKVTLGRPYVFRVAFTDSAQGPVIASLTATQFNFTNAAIIFQEDDPYSSYLAEGIMGYWKYLNKTVAAYSSYNQTNVDDSNFTDQASAIAKLNHGETVLFVPVKGSQVAGIVKAAHDAGWKGHTVGADGWSAESALKDCGEACVGAHFTANFIAEGQVGYAKRFVDKYFTTYGVMPDPHAALAYDAMNLIKVGLEQNGLWSCDLAQNKNNLRAGLQNVTNFQGVAGEISKFDLNGNPFEKCIPIGQVGNNSLPLFIYSYCAGSI